MSGMAIEERFADYPAVIPVERVNRSEITNIDSEHNKEFSVIHLIRINDGTDVFENEPGIFSREKFETVYDWLAHYRYSRIPQVLREICETRGYFSTDIEGLLNHAGYVVSFIADELFYMIDRCLDLGICTDVDMRRIRQAYNSLSGFENVKKYEIVDFA